MRKEDLPLVKTINMAPKDNEVDLLQLFGTVWRGKWRIAFWIAFSAILGGLYVFRIAVPYYTSTVTIALEARNNQVVDFESVVSGLSVDETAINTEVEVLRARILIGKLVDQLKLGEDPEFNPRLRPIELWSVSGILAKLELANPNPPPRSDKAIRDTVIDQVLKVISVGNIRNSYVFQISAETEDAEKSAYIADTLAELYINDQLTTKFQATEQATTWLTERVTELKIELEEAETKVKEYNSSIDLIGPEALIALNRQLKDLRARQGNSERQLANLSTQLSAMQNAQIVGDALEMATASGNEALITAATRIAQNPNTRPAFDARFTEELTRTRLARDREAAQVQALSDSVRSIEAKVESQSIDLVKLQQLEREAAASGLIYEYFLSRLKETSVQQGIQQADSRILSYAVVTEKPSQPAKGTFIAIAMVVGAFFGSVLVILREMRQNGFRSAEDLEAVTGVTVIGQIPRAPNARRRKVLDYIVSKPTSALVEAVRNLRTSILLSNIDKPPQIIMITSSVPGEGKTTQTLALAQNLAGLGRKVLVIEGDIRQRTFGKYFDLKARKGLLSAISAEAPLDEVVWHSDQLGVDILIGEQSNVNAADIFSSKRFDAFLKQIRKDYNTILIDTPPVLAVPDARVIAQISDAVVYVVHWDKTPRTLVEQGLHAFATVNVPVTGLVLSQINPKGMKRYGGKYGDTYSAYDAKYYNN